MEKLGSRETEGDNESPVDGVGGKICCVGEGKFVEEGKAALDNVTLGEGVRDKEGLEENEAMRVVVVSGDCVRS